MSLQTVPLPALDQALPDDVERFLREADLRMEAFVEERVRQPIHAFVASDFRQVYRTLREIKERNLAPGRSFCEWGSGLGAVTCLASILGFTAVGIEYQRELVRRARTLATDFGTGAQFFEGSFIPTGGEHFADAVSEFSWLETGGVDAHEEMGEDPDDFDLIFAYPWPGEEDVLFELFDHYAAEGSLLVTYHGIEALKVQRKTFSREDW